MKLGHLGLALGIFALAGWFVVLRPTGLGGPASYIFVSGVSMQPTLESGDLVVLQRDDTYETGDIVAFHIPDGPGAGTLVIHRIVGGSAADGFVMQGDDKSAADEWRPMPDDIEGSLWVRVPGAGTAVAWLRSPAVFAALAAGVAVFLVLIGGSNSPKRTAGDREATRG